MVGDLILEILNVILHQILNVISRHILWQNTLILRYENNTRNEEFFQSKTLHFTEWERGRMSCRSKLSNQERRWPGTDVSNILVFRPRTGWNVFVSRTALKTRSDVVFRQEKQLVYVRECSKYFRRKHQPSQIYVSQFVIQDNT